MARPRAVAAAENRTRRLILRLTEGEAQALATAAEQAQRSVSAWVRELIRDAVAAQSPTLPPVASEAEGGAPEAPSGRPAIRALPGPAFAVADQLRRIGININQHMVLAHVRGDPPPGLYRIYTKLDTVLDRILAGVPDPPVTEPFDPGDEADSPDLATGGGALQ